MTQKTGWDAWAEAAVFVYHADGLGHYPDGNTGPRVPEAAIREVAARLREGLAPSSVYRLGRWDAFMIPITKPLTEARARALGARIATLVDRPASRRRVAIGSWIGIAFRRANASDDRLSERAGYAAWSAHWYHDNRCIRL